MNKDITLIHGDCLEEMVKLPKGCVDVICCDPPFGTTNCKWDAVIPFVPMWDCIWHVLKPNGVAVIMGTQPFSSVLVCSQLEHYAYDWIWKKEKGTGFQMAKYQPMRIHEHAHVFYKEFGVYNPQMTKGTPYTHKGSKQEQPKYLGDKKSIKRQTHVNTGERNPVSIVEFRRDGGFNDVSGLHPTQKPVELMMHLVKSHSNEGDLVLDFTAGSGSTGVACIKTGRKCVLIEQNDEYMQIIRERLAKPIIREDAKDDWKANMPLAQNRLFDDETP